MGKNISMFTIGGVEVPMTIDSGADAYIANRAVWNQTKEAGVRVQNMSTVIDLNLLVYASAQPMDITRVFMAEIEAGGNKDFAKFCIVENDKQCLLGDRTDKKLKVLKVGFNMGAVQDQRLKPFPKLYVIVEIPININVQPVQQPYRRPPIALEHKIEAKLRDLLQQDIIERVDELLSLMNGAVRFSKMDIKDAYHQVEISETSRAITTVNTKHGLFKYKRLMFGVSCAPESFQKVMESIIAGLDGMIIYLGDVVVYDKTQKEHDDRLNAVLQRVDEYGVLLNDKKCVYNVRSSQFRGHILSVEGVRPTESRTDAI
ncbi:uncharacterized protein LOC128740626 [Sabethes cyaneus]|uniref:uncharacterized protein LOC128740626 n=1 Tax=Sabethes cyaneus TaxID=53552 RepID=UPI00237E65A8|nr:uncharacterized protein LOC128740626 [Sabethes cyaneus]